MSGTGSFDKDSLSLNEGGGIFQIFDFSSAGPPPPKTVLASGTWEATSLVSYSEAGTWGGFASGLAVLNIVLTSTDGTTQAATLTIKCDLGPAGLSAGPGPEGITVLIGSSTLSALSGLTVFDVIG